MILPRRAIGILLLVYAAVGLALAGLVGIVGIDAAGRVERLTADADATITAAARATEAAAGSFANVDVSLDEAQASADAAAALAREASGTLGSLATAMSLTILGSQPLQPLADEFTASASQANDLAATLDRVGDSLGDTRADAAAIAPELEALSERLEALGVADADPTGSPPLRLLVVVLIAWLVMQAVAALVVGVTLVRPARPVA